MPFSIQCAPTETGPSVSPCTDVEGVAYVPVMVEAVGSEYDYANAQSLYGWAFVGVMTAFLIGYVVGNILRLLKLA